MDTASIAASAKQVIEALKALIAATDGLPGPRLNFSMSLQHLHKLKEWAEENRLSSGFPDAEALETALAGGIRKTVEGLPAVQVPTEAEDKPESPEPEAKPEEQSRASDSSVPEQASAWLSEIGRLGGKKRTEAQRLAAQMNMRAINATKRAARQARDD